MWDGWPIARILLVFTSIAFLMIFIQVTLFHSRQNFRHWAMWLPVVASPLLGVLMLILAFLNLQSLRSITSYILIAGILGGLIGFYYHFMGVGVRVGGYKMNNFLVGPPVILPLMVTAMSVLGLIILRWR